jgi:hypothetical protein
MAFREAFISQLDKSVKNFVDSVAEKHGLDPNELYEIWNSAPFVEKSVAKPKTSVVKPPVVTTTEDITMERLVKATKPELSGMCKAHGLKCTGKKDELVDRLKELLKTSEVATKPETAKTATAKTSATKPETAKPPQKLATKSESKTATASMEVIKKLTSKIPNMAIRKNAFGNYEHPETSLVFEKDTHKVIGKQLDSGKIATLTDEDIEQCKKFKFTYEIPDNLDKNNTNVKIAELDDKDQEEEEEIVVEEEVPVEEEEEDEEEEEEEEEILVEDG